jgi:hypothetical protein
MTNKLGAMGILAIAAILAGCGGGGSNSSTSTPSTNVTTSAEGVYQGTVSNGTAHNTLVLENGQYYTMYGTSTSGVFYVSGFIQGTGTSNNGSFSSTDLKDFYFNGTVVSGSLSASYSPNVSFNGSITEGTSTMTFTGAPLQNSSYSYKTAANLANVVGSWNMTGLRGEAIALSIASSGTFTGSSGGCSFTGTIQPRASGKNVFDVSLTFGAAPCALPGQSASGVGLEYPLASGQRQLLIAGTNATRANGTAFLGTR